MPVKVGSLLPDPVESKPARLLAVDLFRGIAAFGVIAIHSGLVVHGHVTPAVARAQFGFGLLAVPFFLAAAIHFRIRSLSRPGRNARSGRLLIPYAAWTVIYFIAGIFDSVIVKHETRLSEICRDPLGLIFFGEAGLALYFLPLLMVGQLLAGVLRTTCGRISRPTLWLMLIGSMVAAGKMDATGNSFNLTTGHAFQPALEGLFGHSAGSNCAALPTVRLAGVALAFAIRCLPYVLLACIWNDWRGDKINRTAAIAISFGLGMILIFFRSSGIAIPEALIGFCILLLSIYVSGWIPPKYGKLAATVGSYSFGIYLLHELLLQAVKLQLAHSHVFSAGIGLILLVVSATFLCACGILKIVNAAGSLFLRQVFGLTG